MKSRRPLATTLVAITLAGCGGGGKHLSPAAYRKAALAACDSDLAYGRSLPTLQRTQHLSVAQLEQRVKQHGLQYIARVRALDPPSQLQAAHQRLLTDMKNAPTGAYKLAVIVAYGRRIARDYAALGLGPCATAVRASNDRVERQARVAGLLGP
jgi:hypothetical protein